MSFPKNAVLTAIFLTGSLVNATAQTPIPEAIAAPGEAVMLTLHAEGAPDDRLRAIHRAPSEDMDCSSLCPLAQTLRVCRRQ